MATGHPAARGSAHRPIPTPLRRGAAVAAVTGGALSLVGATSPLPVVAAAPVALADPAGSTEMVLLSAVEPVVPDPDVVDAGDLVKAVQLAEQQITRLAAERAAAEARAVRAKKEAEEKISSAGLTSPDCGLNTSGLGAVKSYVRSAAEILGCRFGEPSMHGVAGRAGTSDHPSGKAVDFMVSRTTGDALAACALRNQEALGITYVIWEQQINYGNGWEPMEDRGGVTANHFDHVHVSFGSRGGSGALKGC